MQGSVSFACTGEMMNTFQGIGSNSEQTGWFGWLGEVAWGERLGANSMSITVRCKCPEYLYAERGSKQRGEVCI